MHIAIIQWRNTIYQDTCLYFFLQNFYYLNKISYCKISQHLEAARYGFKIVCSRWILQKTLELCCHSNFISIPTLWPQDFIEHGLTRSDPVNTLELLVHIYIYGFINYGQNCSVLWKIYTHDTKLPRDTDTLFVQPIDSEIIQKQVLKQCVLKYGRTCVHK